MNYFEEIGLDLRNFSLVCGVLILAMLLTGTIGRLVFGKRSVIGGTVSSCIAILFIYALTFVLSCAGSEYQSLVAPLPFVTFQDSTVYMHSFYGDFSYISNELLSMVVLAFLVNLIDSWLPRGKNLFSWLLLRTLTVFIGLILHIIAVYLFNSYAPPELQLYAPAILLGILVLLILTGALKLVVGVILVSVNPVIAALYTFFFANIFGKQITEAVLTTALLAALVFLLNYLGVFVISIIQTALIAYIPFAVILVVLWYIANKVF